MDCNIADSEDDEISNSVLLNYLNEVDHNFDNTVDLCSEKPHIKKSRPVVNQPVCFNSKISLKCNCLLSYLLGASALGEDDSKFIKFNLQNHDCTHALDIVRVFSVNLTLFVILCLYICSSYVCEIIFSSYTLATFSCLFALMFYICLPMVTFFFDTYVLKKRLSSAIMKCKYSSKTLSNIHNYLANAIAVQNGYSFSSNCRKFSKKSLSSNFRNLEEIYLDCIKNLLRIYASACKKLQLFHLNIDEVSICEELLRSKLCTNEFNPIYIKLLNEVWREFWFSLFLALDSSTSAGFQAFTEAINGFLKNFDSLQLERLDFVYQQTTRRVVKFSTSSYTTRLHERSQRNAMQSISISAGDIIDCSVKAFEGELNAEELINYINLVQQKINFLNNNVTYLQSFTKSTEMPNTFEVEGLGKSKVENYWAPVSEVNVIDDIFEDVNKLEDIEIREQFDNDDHSNNLREYNKLVLSELSSVIELRKKSRFERESAVYKRKYNRELIDVSTEITTKNDNCLKHVAQPLHTFNPFTAGNNFADLIAKRSKEFGVAQTVLRDESDLSDSSI